MKKTPESPKNEVNKSGAERPGGPWGASFTAVLPVLLKTRPMPKEEKNAQRKNK